MLYKNCDCDEGGLLLVVLNVLKVALNDREVMSVDLFVCYC